MPCRLPSPAPLPATGFHQQMSNCVGGTKKGNISETDRPLSTNLVVSLKAHTFWGLSLADYATLCIAVDHRETKGQTAQTRSLYSGPTLSAKICLTVVTISHSSVTWMKATKHTRCLTATASCRWRNHFLLFGRLLSTFRVNASHLGDSALYSVSAGTDI